MNIKSVLKLMDMKTLVAGFFPVLFGSVYSLYAFNRMNWFILIGLVVAIALVQSSANMFNDFMDFHRGADENNNEEKVLISGELNQRQIVMLICAYLFTALMIGIVIASQSSWSILLVAVGGAMVAALYSTGPMPISYTPFGEVAAGITMGIGITSTVVYIQAGQFRWQSIGMALPTVIYIAYIMFTNNLCDRDRDIKAGRHTLPGLLGFRIARRIWILSSFLLVLVTLILIGVGVFPVWDMIILLLLLNYRSIYGMRRLSPEEFQKGRMMGVIGKIGAQYHILMIVGLLLSYFL